MKMNAHERSYRVTFIYGLGRTVYSPFSENVHSHSRPKQCFPLNMTFLIQKIKKQDMETIDKRVKEVPSQRRRFVGDQIGAQI